MNDLMRKEAEAARRESNESLDQLRLKAAEIAQYLHTISNQAENSRPDAKALRSMAMSWSFIRSEEVRSERGLINHYHAQVGAAVIAIYEALKRRGFEDKELERIYTDPKTLGDVRQISHRFTLLAEQVPQWSCLHLEWSEVFGGPGVWLDLYGPESDPRTNVWCRVTAPDGKQVERDETDAFSGSSSGPRPAGQINVRWLYPQHFPDAPDKLKELPDGKYQVRWYGQRGVGREFLIEDAFLIESGQVTDLDGTPAKKDPDLGD